MALGATEQHGPHMPLATDALIGDHLARIVAERLDAFLAPTLRVGCSEHHVGFAGTISLSEETYHSVIAEMVRSLLRGGFGRIVLLPTHGGNFGPLAGALAKLEDSERAHVVALTDLGVLFEIARIGEREFGVPLGEGGLHAGEWETSLMLAIHPELVAMEAVPAGLHGGHGGGRRRDVRRRRGVDLRERHDRGSRPLERRAWRALLVRGRRPGSRADRGRPALTLRRRPSPRRPGA